MVLTVRWVCMGFCFCGRAQLRQMATIRVLRDGRLHLDLAADILPQMQLGETRQELRTADPWIKGFAFGTSWDVH